MERVYLLLRNNQQSGPFTIGELLQQQLWPSDMIWIEGKSSAWTYLSELELIPFVKNFDGIATKNNARSGEDEIEKKAEELRRKVLASAPKSYFPNHTVEIETYSSSYKFPEEEIQFIDHRKEKSRKNNTVLGEFLLTCFVIGLFMVGIYKGKSFLGAKHEVQQSVATELNSNDQHAAQKNKAVSQVSTTNETTQRFDSLSFLQKTKQKFLISRKKIDSSTSNLSQPVIATVRQENNKEETTQSALPIPQENSIKKQEVLKKEIVPSVPEIKTNNEPVKEEKKGFLKGLFKKKKKDGKNVEEKGG